MEPYKVCERRIPMNGPGSGPNNSGRLAQEDTDELYGAPEEEEDEDEQSNGGDDEEE
jgi:hypothetical protein